MCARRGATTDWPGAGDIDGRSRPDLCLRTAMKASWQNVGEQSEVSDLSSASSSSGNFSNWKSAQGTIMYSA